MSQPASTSPPAPPTAPDRPAFTARVIDPDQWLRWERRFSHYRALLSRLVRLHVPAGRSVLEIGGGLGDLLASLAPSRGVLVEPRAAIAEAAGARHPELHVLSGDPAAFDLAGETFDYVILANVLGDVRDIQALLAAVRRVCRRDTRLIVAYPNALWEPLLKLATRVGLRRPTGEQNWLSRQDLANLLDLTDFEVVRTSTEVLLPIRVPLLSPLLNRLLVRFWPWYHLGLVQLLIARPIRLPAAKTPRVSVIVPTRNERGNIAAAVERTPPMGSGTELIFVDGNSTDSTAAEIERQIAAHPGRDIRLILQGDGRGKGDAVRKGFAAATGDVLMILDADLTVPPEMLPRFVAALVEGRGEFINGTRLVYPMEQDAMRFLNKLGNRFFSIVFTWLLNQPIRDTLCGTKVLSRASYDTIAANRAYFGDFDPFGDFDLLLGAAKANLRIVEIPVRYEARTYGTTNISRFRHGWLLLKMSWFAFCRLKLR
ncbi:MAG: glycosyltransferase [Phycisphaerae bacterium]